MNQEMTPERQENNSDSLSKIKVPSKKAPRLIWDLGTAYDLFISLDVLHNPERFGLRPSWAAGVRSRLSAEDRKTLEESKYMIGIPYHLIHALPEPKDGATLLWALRQLPSNQRLYNLSYINRIPSRAQESLKDISERGSWGKQDLETVFEFLRKENHKKISREEISGLLNIWANPSEFGERYLQSLQTYHQVFFAEEEQHIASALKTALQQAQQLSEKLPLDELLEHLSQGLHLPGYLEIPNLMLAPSYWSTPLVYLGELSPDCSIVLFGARPKNASLVPGELVPDALLRVLKAMADPTRLRILRYLLCEQLTPAEISRRLRLRAPTVTHHLSDLRLAGLVHIMVKEHKERRYTARVEAVKELNELLEDFLQCEKFDEGDGNQ